MFQRKLYNNYVYCVVYCLLCCVLFVVYHSTVLCQQSNANFFNKIYLFFLHKFILCKLLMFFFLEWCRFLSVCMQCPVDVTESLVELLRFWSRFVAVTPSFRWPDWAIVPSVVGAHGHIMQQTINFLFTNRFSQFFAAKNSAISRL